MTDTKEDSDPPSRSQQQGVQRTISSRPSSSESRPFFSAPCFTGSSQDADIQYRWHCHLRGGSPASNGASTTGIPYAPSVNQSREAVRLASAEAMFAKEALKYDGSENGIEIVVSCLELWFDCPVLQLADGVIYIISTLNLEGNEIFSGSSRNRLKKIDWRFFHAFKRLLLCYLLC